MRLSHGSLDRRLSCRGRISRQWGAMTRRRGFTLIEMIVVVIIVAVMASVLVPAYSKFYARQRFDSSVQDVQGAFAYARELSLQLDAPVTLNFDPQSETFAVDGSQLAPPVDQPSNFPDVTSNNATLSQTHVVPLDPGVRIVGFSTTDDSLDSVSGPNAQPTAGGGRGATSVHFRPDGTSDGAELTVVDPVNGYSVHLTLQPATSRMLADQ